MKRPIDNNLASELTTAIRDLIKAKRLEPFIDIEQIQMLISADRESPRAVIHSLVKIFKTDAPALMSQLRRSSQEGDEKTLSRSAHTLKSCAANLGFQRITLAAMSIEHLKTEDRMATYSQIQTVQMELNRVADFLNELEKLTMANAA